MAVPTGGAAKRESHETYVGVQILRGLAALLVVIFHTGLMVRDWVPGAGDHWTLRFGAAGVDIFFPISGFVMLISTRALIGRADGWRTFVRRRIIRIVPLYWLATTAKIAAVLAVPSMALHTDLTWWHSVASYLFVFARDGNGAAQPVLPVGWTLNYEMFFYAVFALALFRRVSLVLFVSAVMLAAAAAHRFIPSGATFLTVLHPIVLEFVAGMWIAAMLARGIRLGLVSALIVTVLALAVLAATDAIEPASVERARLLLWGIPGALLVLAAVSLEPWIALCKRGMRLPKLVGDASYALYLSHGFVLPVFGVAFAKTGFGGTAGAAVAFLLAVTASVVVGVLTHLWIERPMTAWLGRRSRARAVRGMTPARDPAAGPAVPTA